MDLKIQKTIKTIETKGADIHLLQNGDLYSVYHPVKVDGSMCTEMIQACLKLSSGTKRSNLVDLRELRGATSEAIRTMGKNADRFAIKAAVIIGSAPTQIVFNLFVNIYKPKFSIKAFTDEQSAIQWLSESSPKYSYEELDKRFVQLEDRVYKWTAPREETIESIQFFFSKLKEVAAHTPYANIVEISNTKPPSLQVREEIKNQLLRAQNPPSVMILLLKKNLLGRLLGKFSFMPAVGLNCAVFCEESHAKEFAQKALKNNSFSQMEHFLFIYKNLLLLSYSVLGFLVGLPAALLLKYIMSDKVGIEFTEFLWVPFLIGGSFGLFGSFLGRKLDKLRQKAMRLSEELALSDSIIRRTQENANIGSFRFSKDFGDYSFSKEVESILEYDPYLLCASEAWFSIFEDEKMAQAKFKECIELGREFSIKTNLESKFGKPKWINLRGEPLVKFSKIIGVVGTIQDVTDFVQTEFQLQHNEKLASMGELVAGVGHEINNPLTVVKGKSKKILKALQDKKYEEIEESAEKISIAVKRIESIVDDLRIYSRKDSPDNQVGLINEAMTQIEGMLSDIYHHDGIQLTFNITQKELYAQLSIGRLQQVLMNLIKNAKDAMSNQKEPQISVSLESLQGRAVIKVTDNGEGIPLKIQKKIFETFFTTKVVGEGTGLGLGVSKKIIETMGGVLNFISEEGKGTIFTIEIPLLDTSEAHKLIESVKTSTEVNKGPSVSNLRILLVDDEELVREILKEFLIEFDCVVEEASSGPEALKLLIGNTYDLIFTDMKMPKMTGLELARKIKAENLAPQTGLVLISGCLEINDEVQTIFDDQITKPFSEDQVEEILKNCCLILESREKVA